MLAQVVNVLILKVKNIAIVAAEKSIFFQKLDRSAKSVLCMFILTNNVNWHSESLRSDRENTENTGNLKIQFEWVP